MGKEIYIIDNTKEIYDIINEAFGGHIEYRIRNIATKNIDKALKDIPEIFIINEDGIEEDILKLSEKIRDDEDNSITPVLVVSSNKDQQHVIDVFKTSVEMYVSKPINREYLYYLIKNITRLLYVNRRISPLTGLPGNVQIQAEIKKRLANKANFAVVYFDLDNFKAYNDYYGFLRGDEVLKFLGRTIWNGNSKLEGEENFVGHVGGDDFVAIVDCEQAERLCQSIIAEFDSGIYRFFNKPELERGYIEISNRKGVIEEFPLVSLSIGVVEVESSDIINILEISEIGAQVKHAAKSVMGSSYVINKRNNTI